MQPEFGTSQKYNTEILYNSRNLKYKSPFGAVSTAQRVDICFPVKNGYFIENVRMIIRGDDGSVTVPLPYSKTENDYSFFAGNFLLEKAGTYFYRFEIQKSDGIIYVGRGVNGQAVAGEWLPEWILNVYAADFNTPDFFKGGVCYQIFVDRFCKKGPSYPPRYGVKKEWNEDVTIVDSDGVYRANDFFGGNFAGIISKLDYLAELGVTMIYLSPIFLSNSNHRYDTGDYMSVEPMLGGEKMLAMLIDKAKEKGIGIMLDGVFNHTGADSVYFNKFGHFNSVGAYQSKTSPYHNWFTFDRYPDEYHCWWGITVVPTVERNCEEFHKFIAGRGGVIEKYTQMGVKGWRLDVVDELSSRFVKQIRSAVKNNDKECLVLGEVWEDASTKYSYGEEREYFRGRELDGVMNYPFKEAIIKYVTGGDAEAFISSIADICENYPKQCLDSCLSLIDSHDTVRAINILSGTRYLTLSKAEKKNYRLTEEEYELGKKRLIIAGSIQYFLPGVPNIYYGDEIGMQGFDDPLNRRPYDWENGDTDILTHYRKLGALRRNYKECFTDGISIDSLNGMIKIRRKCLSLIVNVSGATKELDKAYSVLNEITPIKYLNANSCFIAVEKEN